jgi:hypothetical protein
MKQSEMIARILLNLELERTKDVDMTLINPVDTLGNLLRCLLYIALNQDDVEILHGLPNKEKDIRDSIAEAGIYIKDEIVRFAEHSILLKEAINTPQTNFMSIFHNQLKSKFIEPDQDFEGFLSQMFEIYQMVEIVLNIEKREDLIEDLKDLFSEEEHQAYDMFIKIINLSIKESGGM